MVAVGYDIEEWLEVFFEFSGRLKQLPEWGVRIALQEVVISNRPVL